MKTFLSSKLFVSLLSLSSGPSLNINAFIASRQFAPNCLPSKWTNLNISSLNAMTTQVNPANNLKYLTQDEAINLDRQLFDEYAFSVDQLMELAGLSVATAIAKCYPLSHYHRPIVCCGPGNNGGDGLVCARHLKLFGYEPLVVCLKPGRTQLYQNLLCQCEKFQISILNQIETLCPSTFESNGNLIVDCLFGFSFKPPNRNAQFAKLLNYIHSASIDKQIPLISVDIPSGWHVETGDQFLIDSQANIEDELKIPALKPDCLISLTAPKLCAKHFKGKYHYLGGRFCPQAIQDKYKLNLPQYLNTDVIVKLN